MRKFMPAIAMGTTALTLLIAGCSGGGGDKAPAVGAASGGSTSSTALKMEDIKFDKAALSATKGQMLTIALTNAGALEHDFIIDKIDAVAKFDGKDAKDAKYAVYAAVKPKASGKLEITPNSTGAFEYYCAVAGHKEAGMKGTLTVK